MKKIITQQISERAWKHLFSGFVCLAFIFVAGPSTAQTNNSQVERLGKNGAVAEKKSNWDAEQKVLQMLQGWRNGKGKELKKERPDIFAGYGTATAALNSGDKRWGKSRSMAYSTAYLEAMKEWTKAKHLRTIQKVSSAYFEQDVDVDGLSLKKDDSTGNYAARLAKKIGMLGERKINEALAETGMSADEIERLNPMQKKCTLSKSIIVESTTIAVGSAAGLIPFETFEAFDDEGNTAIGVVVLRSENMANLAKQISGRRSIRAHVTKKGSPIDERINDYTTDQLIDIFGTRVLWDEHGFQTVVGFGQWAWSSKGLNKRKKARRRAFALKQAETDAMLHLSTFINAGTRFVDTVKRGVESDECSIVNSDKTVDEVVTDRIIDERWEKAKVRSTINLTGRLVVRSWFGEHPAAKGNELVGVVVSWSPRNEDRIRRVQGKNPKHQPITKTNKRNSKKKVFSEGTRKSPDIMKAKDF
jgi:hypothetical protein